MKEYFVYVIYSAFGNCYYKVLPRGLIWFIIDIFFEHISKQFLAINK
jgi:hypothetical protein